MNYIDTGWLDPKGKLCYADYMDHYAVAEEIIEEKGFKPEPGESSDDTLLRNGYVRISCLRLITFGIVFSFPFKKVIKTINNKTYELNNWYCSPEQREYIRKMYETDRDMLANTTFHDLLQLKIITEEEYWNWMKESDPEAYKRLGPIDE